MNQILMLDEARSAYRAGLCILPVAPDGTKRPDVPAWTSYQTTRPTAAQMRAFHFARRTGFGMIAGPVSGRRAAWDFDCPHTYRAFVAAAEGSGLGEAVQRIASGYCDETPGGGRRWIVHYPEGVTWRDETLARRPGGEDEPPIKTLIELPTFAILAPSHGPTHPSGRPYVRVAGSFHTIAAVSADEHGDLVALARTFDAMLRIESGDARMGDACTAHQDDRPGDEFNRCASWREILEPAGWRHISDRGDVGYWCRPGKTRGVSATTNRGGTDRLYVFTSSTAFEPDRAYSKFAAYAVLQHGGNFVAAAHDLTARRPAAPARTTPAVRLAHHASDPAPITVRPVLVRLQDVSPEPVTWLWPGRVAVGKLALLVGDPGLGKSWITLDLAARVSAGRVMPDGAPAVSPADVILLSAEDGLADTIRPRLDALGADVARIHHLAVLRAGDAERAVQLADTAALELAMGETGARLLIIDPVSAYLGSTDAHRDAEVRGLLAPLAALAERREAAILGVMHLAKTTQRLAIHRAVGSIAFTAAARTVLAVVADPEREDRRLMAPIKSNLAASPAALGYTLNDGRLVWAAEPVSHVDIDVLLSGPVPDRQERRVADEWLRDLLAGGPMPVGEVQSAARAAGLAWRTIERAKTRLGVRAALLGYGAAGRWQWSLAETASSPDHASETATPREVAVSGEKTEKLVQTPRARHSTADLAVVGPATGQTGDVPRERARF